ncbi:MAG: single-stranded DNA-binding protein [Elusimicrobia bacterium]|nr:single-stranded DNA-binding protein [Elusimicrobiota bacterium]
MEVRLLSQNLVLIAGNLTKDPDYKVTTGGRGVLHLRVAVNRRYQDKASGEWKDDTTFIGVDVWGDEAARLKDRLKKGSPVHVEGRLKSREYEDKATGQKRTAIDILANRVQALEKSGAGGAAPASKGEAGGGKSGDDLEEVPF